MENRSFYIDTDFDGSLEESGERIPGVWNLISSLTGDHGYQFGSVITSMDSSSVDKEFRSAGLDFETFKKQGGYRRQMLFPQLAKAFLPPGQTVDVITNYDPYSKLSFYSKFYSPYYEISSEAYHKSKDGLVQMRDIPGFEDLSKDMKTTESKYRFFDDLMAYILRMEDSPELKLKYMDNTFKTIQGSNLIPMGFKIDELKEIFKNHEFLKLANDVRIKNDPKMQDAYHALNILDILYNSKDKKEFKTNVNGYIKDHSGYYAEFTKMYENFKDVTLEHQPDKFILLHKKYSERISKMPQGGELNQYFIDDKNICLEDAIDAMRLAQKENTQKNVNATLYTVHVVTQKIDNVEVKKHVLYKVTHIDPDGNVKDITLEKKQEDLKKFEEMKKQISSQVKSSLSENLLHGTEELKKLTSELEKLKAFNLEIEEEVHKDSPDIEEIRKLNQEIRKQNALLDKEIAALKVEYSEGSNYEKEQGRLLSIISKELNDYIEKKKFIPIKTNNQQIENIMIDFFNAGKTECSLLEIYEKLPFAKKIQSEDQKKLFANMIVNLDTIQENDRNMIRVESISVKNLNEFQGAFSKLNQPQQAKENTKSRGESVDLPDIQEVTLPEPNQGNLLKYLKAYLNLMREDLKTMGHSKHLKDIDELIVQIKDEKDVTKVMAAIEAAYKKEKDHTISPRFLSFSGKSTKQTYPFESKLNNDSENHHYSRMLGIILQTAYTIDDEKLNSKRPSKGVDRKALHFIKPPESKTNFYDKYIPGLVVQIEGYKEIETKLKQSGLSATQIYRFYKHDDEKFDSDFAKKMWPELKKEFKLSDKTINSLINAGSADEAKKKLDDLKDKEPLFAIIDKMYSIKPNLQALSDLALGRRDKVFCQ